MPKSNATSSEKSGARRQRRGGAEGTRKHAQKKHNYAFIDSQNLHLSIRDAGWKLDLARFRTYLREKYAVSVAYLFMGYMEEYQDLYLSLQKDGFIIIYKDILRTKDGTVKGNVDAELVLQAMIDYDAYRRAVVVTGDGDFACLVRYLSKQDKLETLLVPNQRKYSCLLNKAAGKRIAFVSDLRKKLGYRQKPSSVAKPKIAGKDGRSRPMRNALPPKASSTAATNTGKSAPRRRGGRGKGRNPAAS